METIKEKYFFKKEKVSNIVKLITISIVAGILSGLFSSGGGLILVPALVHVFKLTEKEARALSVFCILPMSIASAIIYNRTNYIDWKLGILCGIGGIIGGVIGANILKNVNDKYLILIFILFLIYVSISILRV